MTKTKNQQHQHLGTPGIWCPNFQELWIFLLGYVFLDFCYFGCFWSFCCFNVINVIFGSFGSFVFGHVWFYCLCFLLWSWRQALKPSNMRVPRVCATHQGTMHFHGNDTSICICIHMRTVTTVAAMLYYCHHGRLVSNSWIQHSAIHQLP